MCSSDRDKISQKPKKGLSGFWGGVLSAIIVVVVASLVGSLMEIDQPFEASSIITVDSDEWRHGKNSLRWEFEVQPERKYRIGRGTLMGCFVHLEVCYDSQGHLPAIDLTGFKGLRFFAKSSSEFLEVTEFNLFVGAGPIQYLYRKAPILIGTKWQEFYLDFNEFDLAPWDKEYKMHLHPQGPYLSHITALGMDMKTTALPASGRIWIDNIRAVRHDNTETLIANCEDMTASFEGKPMMWRSDWRTYGD